MKRASLMAIAAVLIGTSTHAQAGNPRNEPIQPVPPPGVSSPDKVELGKMLFFEPRLSKSGFISCNSCHNLGTGGVDGLPSSIGHRWQLGPINSPTVLNAKFNVAQFWDGRAADLQEQAAGPIANPMEMAATHELAIDVLRSIPEYQGRFKKAFGSEGITIDRTTEAIALFEETLVTPDSRFDEWLAGDDNAMTESERSGYELFKSKGCIACHNGVGVGGGSFQKFGVVKAYAKDPKTLGRYGVTKNDADKYVFKVPLLRNVELTRPYLHDGSTWDLAEAVDIMAEYQLGIELSADENEMIVAFLKTLTGKQPEVVYPVLPAPTAATPKPDRG